MEPRDASREEPLLPPPPTCPGLESDQAGKQSACQGCPNQSACASGLAKGAAEEDAYAISRRLARVKRIILILSGKGGVGKSTLATCVARALSLDPASSVGLLDVDVCGPSIPMTTGLVGEGIHMSSSGWSPVFVQENLAVMSCGFLLESPDAAVVWRGPKKNGLIKQFLRDVDWGDLDYLIVDTPPGTSDEHLALVSLLKNCGAFVGAVLVSTPQQVAVADVRKQVDFCHKVKLRILGFVENMSGFVCPKCDKESAIFPQTSGLERLSRETDVPLLARIPLDPKLAKACDQGHSCFETHADSVAVLACKEAVDALVKRIGSEEAAKSENVVPS